jgi:transcriptional regulator with XRE-family HTH domain
VMRSETFMLKGLRQQAIARNLGIAPSSVHRIVNTVDDIPSASSNRSTKQSFGTTKSYLLSRLNRDYPELYSRVIAGELTALDAAREAGFSKPRDPLKQILKLLPKLSEDGRRQLRAALDVLDGGQP